MHRSLSANRGTQFFAVTPIYCIYAFSALHVRRVESCSPASPHEGEDMLWTIFVILLILWVLGFSFHIAGSLIHLLLVIALIVLIFNLISGRRGAL